MPKLEWTDSGKWICPVCGLTCDADWLVCPACDYERDPDAAPPVD